MFLGVLFKAKQLKQVLIAVPATLLDYWRSEIQRWTPGLHIDLQMLNQPQRKREQLIAGNRLKNNLVYLTTPSMIQKHVDTFNRQGNLQVLIVDEGHRAKNINTKIRKGIKSLYVKRSKIMLTGTPVQNNLAEFYSLMDIVEDDVFGTVSEFNQTYRHVIETGLKKRALFR